MMQHLSGMLLTVFKKLHTFKFREKTDKYFCAIITYLKTFFEAPEGPDNYIRAFGKEKYFFVIQKWTSVVQHCGSKSLSNRRCVSSLSY